MPASNSPEHIVGNHVLLRRCVPRYPPSALIRLTILNLIVCKFSLNTQLKLGTKLLPTLCHYAVFKVLYWKFLQQAVFFSTSVAEFFLYRF
jgi:hypothetical protein